MLSSAQCGPSREDIKANAFQGHIMFYLQHFASANLPNSIVVCNRCYYCFVYSVDVEMRAWRNQGAHPGSRSKLQKE